MNEVRLPRPEITELYSAICGVSILVDMMAFSAT
jgi:hypothetical protein